jgi:Berberine and berberine like
MAVIDPGALRDLRRRFGANYRRLVALKDRFDPDNLVHLNANIRPSAGARG